MSPDRLFVTVRPVPHGEVEAATKIHGIQMRAYSQEATLLGAVRFPPLERTVEDIRTCSEAFLGAFAQGELLGALSYAPDDEGLGVNIASLVVDLPVQGRGIARELMRTFLAAHPNDDITVQTGVKNVPALALYARCGFVEIRRWMVGREPLELVKLRRLSGVPGSTV